MEVFDSVYELYAFAKSADRFQSTLQVVTTKSQAKQIARNIIAFYYVEKAMRKNDPFYLNTLDSLTDRILSQCVNYEDIANTKELNLEDLIKNWRWSEGLTHLETIWGQSEKYGGICAVSDAWQKIVQKYGIQRHNPLTQCLDNVDELVKNKRGIIYRDGDDLAFVPGVTENQVGGIIKEFLKLLSIKRN